MLVLKYKYLLFISIQVGMFTKIGSLSYFTSHHSIPDEKQFCSNGNPTYNSEGEM